MNIGGYRIEGVSRRFWYILAAAVFLIFLMFYAVSSNKPEQVNPFVAPAFSTANLTDLAQKPTWIEPYISAYGLNRPEDPSVFTNQYSTSLGLPFRFRAYIPSTDNLAEQSKLNVNKYGWQFLPSVFLDPTQSVNPEDLSTLSDVASSGQALVLGFPAGRTPAAGQAYEITGLLYWNSNQLKESHGRSSPIILAASARPLAAAELAAPTTHIANLNIVYQQNNLQLDLRRVEWSSGRQVRICVSITNSGSPTPLQRWPGLDNFSAEYEQSVGLGSSTAQTDIDSPLATQQTLNEGSTAVGYILFDQAPSGAPTAPMTLFVPALNSLYGGPPTQVTINPNQFVDVSKEDHSSSGDASDGCFQA